MISNVKKKYKTVLFSLWGEKMNERKKEITATPLF